MTGAHHANGKVILLGEHAVVYGVEALVAGIAKGATAQARLTAPSRLVLGSRTASPGDGSPEAEAFQAILDLAGAAHAQVEVNVDLPLGVGLGGSAAVGVAIARAVLAERGAVPGDPRVLEAAGRWENVFHGSASGVDAAAAYFGGCFGYRKGHAPRPLSVKTALDFAVAVAGPAASTRDMVAQVATFRSRDAAAFDRALEGIATLVRNAEQAIRHGDLHTLGKMMDLNQMLLSAWFLSTADIENACHLAREAGALGAKLTGAGGGGCVLALVEPEQAPAVLDTWSSKGLRCFSARVPAS